MTGPPPFATIQPADLTAALGGRFVVDRKLGHGGQGAVYLAECFDGPAIGKHVALKFYAPGGNDTRIEREVAALTTLSSDHLAAALDHGTVQLSGQDARWVAWQYVEGVSLRQSIQTGSRLSQADVMRMARDVSRALECLWSSRIVHRDVKPDNLLLDVSSGDWILVDLGLARFLNEPSISAAGSACGTFGYMSPEQALGDHRLTSHSDVFALGVTAIEGLLGTHPTQWRQPPLMPPGSNIALPHQAIPVLGPLLVKMVMHDPVARPTPTEIIAALEAHVP
jgi:serine/threonine-protein kinase